MVRKANGSSPQPRQSQTFCQHDYRVFREWSLLALPASLSFQEFLRHDSRCYRRSSIFSRVGFLPLVLHANDWRTQLEPTRSTARPPVMQMATWNDVESDAAASGSVSAALFNQTRAVFAVLTRENFIKLDKFLSSAVEKELLSAEAGDRAKRDAREWAGLVDVVPSETPARPPGTIMHRVARDHIALSHHVPLAIVAIVRALHRLGGQVDCVMPDGAAFRCADGVRVSRCWGHSLEELLRARNFIPLFTSPAPSSREGIKFMCPAENPSTRCRVSSVPVGSCGEVG